jgi:hypothetical protein
VSKAILVGALVALAQPAMVQAQPNNGAVEQAEKVTGYQIAQVTNTAACEKVTYGTPNFEKLVAGLVATPDIADIETDYKGVTRYMAHAMLPILNESVEASMPQLWTDLGAIFDGNFNDIERGWLLKLFQSSGGQKLINSVCENTEIDGIIAEAVSGDGSISVDTVEQSTNASKAKIVKEALKDMTAAEEREFTALALKAGFHKFSKVRPMLIETKTAWMNADDPEYDVLIDDVIAEAITEFMAAKDEGRQPKALPLN